MRSRVKALLVAALLGTGAGCTNDIYMGARAAADETVDSDSASDPAGTETGEGAEDTGEAPELLPLTGDLTVLDPTVIEYEGGYVLFHTGPGISVKRSDDLSHWRDSGTVFSVYPAWIASDFPSTEELWAPDISFFGGVYHLYYGASTFWSNVSCIGHATAPDLSEAAVWTDRGTVVCTTDDDTWNAIDPNWVRDRDGSPWLVLGSYWTGIKAVRLNEAGMGLDDEVTDISSRGSAVATAAPLVIRKENLFYHFVSFDQCCVGVDSTHNIRVGRSEYFLGPYLDRDGVSMMEGGGTLLVAGDERWRGPGHNAVLETGGVYYNVYHAYDAMNDGVPTLRISTMVWDAEGWPRVAGP